MDSRRRKVLEQRRESLVRERDRLKQTGVRIGLLAFAWLAIWASFAILLLSGD